MPQRSIGIDIGGTNLRAACVSSDGQVIERIAEPVTRDPEAVVNRLAALCRALDDPGVAGIGIGIPGRVDAGRRTVLSGGYLDLAGRRVAERLEALLGKPVTIDNDCTMALVAEMALGAARHHVHVAMLTIGTGIGGALALGGDPVRGRATAGQFGHLTVRHKGELCACGRRGCVETTSSGTALGRLMAEAGLPSTTQAAELLGRAAADDPIAADILDRWIGPLRSTASSPRWTRNSSCSAGA